ncbi:MAG: hypothetical protein OXU67_08265 [Chloroflexota bacterium]|nr:hypothetical protein [Chloroflexota bacterium]
MWSTTTTVSPAPTGQPAARLQGAPSANGDCDSDAAIRSTLTRVRTAAPTDEESLERTIYQALAAQRAEAAAVGQSPTPEDDWLTLLSAIAVHEHRHGHEAMARS